MMGSQWGEMPEPARMTEAEATDYVRELYRLENEDPGCGKAVVTFGPASAFVTIGALQLATRHPDMSPGMKHTVGHVIDQLAALFKGTPGAELLGLGNHAVFDVPRECRYPLGPHAPGCPPGDHMGFVPEPVCAFCGQGFTPAEDLVLEVTVDGMLPAHVRCSDDARRARG